MTRQTRQTAMHGLDATLEAVDFIKRIRPYYQQTGTTYYLPPVSDIEQACYAQSGHAGAKNRVCIELGGVVCANGLRCARRTTDAVCQQVERERQTSLPRLPQQQPFWIAWYKGTGTTSATGALRHIQIFRSGRSGNGATRAAFQACTEAARQAQTSTRDVYSTARSTNWPR